MKNPIAVFLGLFIALASTHSSAAAEGAKFGATQMETADFFAPYIRFCPRLARALETQNIHELVEMTEPAFRVAVSNEVKELKLRFDGFRGAHVYCKVTPRGCVYSEDINSKIDSLVCGDIADLVPVSVLGLRESDSKVPFVDRLYVHTLLHRDGSVRIIGRITPGEYTRVSEVTEDFTELRKHVGNGGAAIYRGVCKNVSESEFAWELSRKLRSGMQRGDPAVVFGDVISPNCHEPHEVEALRRLARYRISVIVPYRSDEQCDNNTVHARAGDRCAYWMEVFAEECPYGAVGSISIIVGHDFSFRIISVTEYDSWLGVKPYKGMRLGQEGSSESR